MLAAAFVPVYAMVMLGLFLAGVGKIVYDPALQAFASRHVPFSRRGLVFGLIETSWAGATLVAIPVTGLFMERFGWRAPFFVLGFLSLACLALILAVMPSPPRDLGRDKRPLFSGAWRQVLGSRAARGALAYAFLAAVANDNLFVAYGAWLESAHGLSLVAIGVATTTVGVAELGGEGLVSLLADRLGLARSVLGGTVLASLAYAALPLSGHSLAAGLAGLFAVFLLYEFSIVASISLFTEIVPEARATMMAGFFATSCVGRVAGALLGGPVWSAYGIAGIGVVSCTFSLAAALVLWRELSGWRPAG